MVKKGMQIGLLIFGMTFGAGNLIFPPSLGFQAGPLFWPDLLFPVSACPLCPLLWGHSIQAVSGRK